MIRTTKEAIALVARKGRLPLSGPGSLVEAVAGVVRGSWWAHEDGAVIFRLATALHEHPDVISVKLDGRAQFVHRALWPALVRVATDEKRRAVVTSALSAAARALLDAVERQGIYRITSKARKELEAGLLVRADQEHTEEGHHTAVLESWEHFAREKRVTPAKGSLEEALAALRGSCTSTPSTPARRSRSPSPPRRRRRRSPR